MSDPVVLSSTPGGDLKKFLDEKRYSSVLVLCDGNTARHCYPRMADVLPPHEMRTVMPGEEHKNLDTCRVIWQQMTDLFLDRKSVVVILGGGVLGDMGGFCAATYKRGIDFILVPTTLLAMADASIGGKLGVDFNMFKNHIGVFREPVLTLVHEGFIHTLPERELRSGFCEVIKHLLISDAATFREVAATPMGNMPWDRLIRHSIEFKQSVTREDPTEKGRRKILNAGHTLGHAIETHMLATRRPILHGEAVAAGLVAEGHLAMRRGVLPDKEFREMAHYIINVFGKVPLGPDDLDTVATLCLQDKKNKGGRIQCVFLTGLGKATWDNTLSLEEIKSALEYYLGA